MKYSTITALGFLQAILVVGCSSSKERGSEPVQEVMTAEAQKAMTPAEVLEDLKEGNRRFVEGHLTHRDYLAQAAASASGQYPKAVILSCLDSRVPPEMIFDQGIGDIFVGRIAGNFENTDMLGSMEFATKAAGSRLIVVLGHTSCGAIKGAAQGVELGNLTAMLENFDEALEQARAATSGEAETSSSAFIQAAVEENVRQTMKDILARSPVIAELAASGDVAIVGGVYDLESGRVSWLD
jgi:carbonic anhydrase